MSGLRRGQPTALALVLAAAACTTTHSVVGHPPEGDAAQTPQHHRTMTPAERAEAIRRHQEGAPNGEPTVEEPQPDEPRIGVASTHVFHRPECKLLADVPTTEQVRFTSPWEAVDARYSPCAACRAFE